MKLAMLLTVVAMVLGGIYHTEIQDYFAQLRDNSASSGGAGGGGGSTSYISSMRDMGNSGNALMTGVGGSLNR